jgi:hypothetical protein
MPETCQLDFLSPNQHTFHPRLPGPFNSGRHQHSSGVWSSPGYARTGLDAEDSSAGDVGRLRSREHRNVIVDIAVLMFVYYVAFGLLRSDRAVEGLDV